MELHFQCGIWRLLKNYLLKSLIWFLFVPDFGEIWWPRRRRQWHPTPVLLPGKSHGRRSLVGYSPWGRWGSDTTERLHFHFSLSCIGEGNGNPFQCSCLENPRDGRAWWAAVCEVTQSRTWLKRLSSSSSRWPRSTLLLMATNSRPFSFMSTWCFPGGTVVKNSPANAGNEETWVWSLEGADPLK